MYEDIKKNLKHQQLIKNIEYVEEGYLNGMNDDPENYPPLPADKLIQYCLDEIFDIKDNGRGTTAMGKGICDDLKFLGSDLIINEILRLGKEIGVLDKNSIKQEADINYSEKFKALQNNMISKIINSLIKDEQEAIDGYEKAKTDLLKTNISSNEYDKMFKVFDHIIAEELEHIKELEELIGGE